MRSFPNRSNSCHNIDVSVTYEQLPAAKNPNDERKTWELLSILKSLATFSEQTIEGMTKVLQESNLVITLTAL